jgi:hypothetical protein
MIDPGIWSSTLYQNAETEDEMLAWIVTFQMADDEGRLKYLPYSILQMLRGRRGCTTTEDDVIRWFKKWADDGRIIIYDHPLEHDTLVQLTKQKDYQVLTKPRISNLPPPDGWTKERNPWSGAENAAEKTKPKPRVPKAANDRLHRAELQRQKEDLERELKALHPEAQDSRAGVKAQIEKLAAKLDAS